MLVPSERFVCEDDGLGFDRFDDVVFCQGSVAGSRADGPASTLYQKEHFREEGHIITVAHLVLKFSSHD